MPTPRSRLRGLARDLLLIIVSGPHKLILSSAILVEIQRVLTYPRVQVRWPLTGQAIEQYLVFLEAAGVSVKLPEVSPAVVSDPDDDPILQTAILGRADVLCTRDEAFRNEIVERVCAAHSIKILNDISLLQDLRRPSALPGSI